MPVDYSCLWNLLIHEKNPLNNAQQGSLREDQRDIWLCRSSITSGKEGFSAPIAPITVASNKLPQMTMHIDLQIHISPEASTEQIDAIFASMAKHLYK